MSSSSESVQYNISVSASQPISGADYGVQLTLEQTSAFQDADAVALYNAQVAAVPPGFGTPNAQLSKLDQSMTQSNWSASAQAFQ